MAIRRVTSWVVPALMLLFGVGGAISGWGALQRDREIERSGGRATGVVTSRTTVETSEGTDFVISYRFKTTGGEDRVERTVVSKGFWQGLDSGSRIEVAYATNGTRRTFPVGQGATSIGLALFASVMGTAVAAMGLLGLSSINRS